MLLLPGAVAVELTGPDEDVVAPEGMAALDGPPPAPRGRGLLEAGVPPPTLGELAARAEEAGLGYEARMGVGTCLIAVESAEDVERARGWALALGGHAQVVDGAGRPARRPVGPAAAGAGADAPHARRLRPGRGAEPGHAAVGGGGVSAVARWDPSRPAPATDDIVKCVACGLCLPHCPTFRLTGRETASPRGRIAAMRAVEEGLGEVDASFTTMMDECLACRACEAACPSGVPFGRMIEAARAQAEPTRALPARGLKRLGLAEVLPRRRMVLGAGWLLALARALRLDRLAPPAQRAATPPASLREMLRPIPSSLGSGPTAAVLAGCVMDVAYRPTQRATMRAVAASGRRALRSAPGGCCGALAMHYGQPEAARAMARERIPELEAGEIVVVNASGCSAHVRAYGELLADDPEWAERAERVAAKVVDLIELELPERDRGLGRVAVHDACHHLHAQRIEPRAHAAPGGRRVRRPRRRRPLLRGGGPLQRPPARAGRPAAAPRRPRPSPRRARPWSPWPTPAAPSRSRPACARSARGCGWRTPPS